MTLQADSAVQADTKMFIVSLGEMLTGGGVRLFSINPSQTTESPK